MPDLSTALGDLLPAALGVAISPIPIIATVLGVLGLANLGRGSAADCSGR